MGLAGHTPAHDNHVTSMKPTSDGIYTVAIIQSERRNGTVARIQRPATNVPKKTGTHKLSILEHGR
jgi:hypothetical protein